MGELLSRVRVNVAEKNMGLAQRLLIGREPRQPVLWPHITPPEGEAACLLTDPTRNVLRFVLLNPGARFDAITKVLNPPAQPRWDTGIATAGYTPVFCASEFDLQFPRIIQRMQLQSSPPFKLFKNKFAALIRV